MKIHIIPNEKFQYFLKNVIFNQLLTINLS